MNYLRPSSAQRWINCFRSNELLEHIPKNYDSSNKYTRAGTDLHATLSDALENRISVHDLDASLTPLVLGIQKSKDTIYSEKRLTLSRSNNLVAGTPDIVLVTNDITNPIKLEIIDYKSGYQKVSADSLQLKVYAALALDHYLDYKNLLDDAVIQCTIFQNNESLEEARDASIQYPIYDLIDFTGHLRQLATDFHEANWGKYSFNPEKRTCQWCLAQSKCRAYADSINLNSRHLNPSLLSQDELIEAVKKGKAIKQWLNTVEDFLLKEHEAGIDIPGIKFRLGRKIKSWKNKEEIQEYLKVLGIDPYSKKLLSPSQASKIVGTDLIEDHIEVKYAKPTMIVEDSITDFEDLDDLTFEL